MKLRTTIKNKIFAFNLFTVILLQLIIAVAFNVSARIYMEQQALSQLRKLASRAEEESSRNYLRAREDGSPIAAQYFAIARTARQRPYIFNTEISFVDEKMNVITPYRELTGESSAFEQRIVSFIIESAAESDKKEITFQFEGDEYAAIVVSLKNNFPANVGKMIFYTSLDRIADLQRTINLILIAVSLLAAIIVLIVSSYLSKKISTPISKLCTHIRDLSQRKFRPIQIPADDEILELVNNINIMTERLDTYDQAQKTFLQNASHELRTPIMSIRSYAEGIQYGVVECNEAVTIILDETARLTQLVESLLYLSRLDSLDEPYNMELLDFHQLLHFCTVRMQAIAKKQGKEIIIRLEPDSVKLFGDEEKLTRAVTNLLDNSIRYAEKNVILESRLSDMGFVEFTVSDDGPGFDTEDLKQLFARFYKGKQGHFGLGLSITKSIIEKHNGTITAGNDFQGACIRVRLPI